jgi:hypothetical protein
VDYKTLAGIKDHSNTPAETTNAYMPITRRDALFKEQILIVPSI